MNIATENLKGLIDKHFFKDLSKEGYLVQSMNPKNLLTYGRFDLGFKLIYLELKEKNKLLAEEVYEVHIKAFTLGKFEEPGNKEKNTLKKYLESFDYILKEIYLNGFDNKRSIIPLSEDGSIANGSHRTAASIFLNKEVQAVNLFSRNQLYNYIFFKNRNVNEFYLDFAASKFIEKSNNIHVALIWPSAQGKSQEIESIIPNIIYNKSVSLTPNGAHNLISQVYNKESWLGTREENFKGAKGKLVECFKTFRPLRIYFFQSDSIEEVKAIKQSIRDLFKIGKHSIHISDTKKEALRISKNLLNNNSIHFLNYSMPNKFNNHFKEILSLKNRAQNLEDFVIVGNVILSLYGIRESNQFNYIIFDKKSPNYKIMSSLIYDPRNYFYYEGLKFISINKLYQDRENYNLNKNDVDIIKKIIEKKGVKFLYNAIKGYFNYLLVRFRVRLINFLKAIGLYTFLKSIYNYLKK